MASSSSQSHEQEDVGDMLFEAARQALLDHGIPPSDSSRGLTLLPADARGHVDMGWEKDGRLSVHRQKPDSKWEHFFVYHPNGASANGWGGIGDGRGGEVGRLPTQADAAEAAQVIREVEHFQEVERDVADLATPDAT